LPETIAGLAACATWCILPSAQKMHTPHDTPDSASAHPVLTIEEAKQFEAALFGGDGAREWPAMQCAGRAIAEAVVRDFREIGKFPGDARVLVLAGKGHNGGDALIAAKCILEKYPRTRVSVCFVFGERAQRPLAKRAWREISGQAQVVHGTGIEGEFDLCLEGIFGFQFRPPVDERTGALIARVNALPVRFRAAVDMPGGGVFRADFTYATGIVKTPVLESAASGRVRYLDLGFFASGGAGGAGNAGDASSASNASGSLDPYGQDAHATQTQTARTAHATQSSILTPAILAPLRALRPPHTDKRDYGHLFIIGGSRKYPGAVLMSVLAALHSGAGLVTAFVPESLVPAYAARAPEAIWCGMAESPGGGLALEDFTVLRERLSATKGSTGTSTGTGCASALLIGPGLSRDREALVLAAEILRADGDIPVVLDADALQPEIVLAGTAPRILTPHAGEYQRIAAAVPSGAVVVRKGPLTRIGRGGSVYVSPFGGPVLARGGSGDLLAGMIGGVLAQAPGGLLLPACRGTVWHGMAAECLARARGQQAVRVTQVLDYLPEALRNENA
jgi:NAD(P)H-hydrate epimerase